ncbi:hypothetical protein P9112_006540 [Eukaryota sp. TZLM1-RC]
MKCLPLCFILVSLCFAGSQALNHSTISLKSISSSSHVTVSGLSAGAFMSTQFHVAYSKTIKGMGSFSGGPYFCSNSNVVTATTSCMTSPYLISVTELIGATTYARTLLSIDSTSNLKSAKVYIYSPKDDSTVVQGVSKKLHTYYEHYVGKNNIKTVFGNRGEHAFPTDNYGSSCLLNQSPYINNCDYDGAKDVLQWLIGGLPSSRAEFNDSNLYYFSQSSFMPGGVSTASLSFAPNGMVYVPSQCKNNKKCKLHVVFHGCHQGMTELGETFVRHTGYCQWGEAAGIILLFPQIQKSSVVPYNPKGCWDWFGYTGPSFACKLGPQMQAVRSMVESITGNRM